MQVTKVMKPVTAEVLDGVTITLNKDQAEQLMGILGGINHPAESIVEDLYNQLEKAGVEFGRYNLRAEKQGGEYTPIRLRKVNG